MHHIDFLKAQIALDGLTVADVGAGAGGFARLLRTEGAMVTGIEIDAARIAAIAPSLPDGVRLIEGRAEAMPLTDASQDLVCFIQSMHHVPATLHDTALAEAWRVLRPAGRLHVAEPRPSGSMFAAVRLVEDETEVRTVAQARMGRVGAAEGFRLLARRDYDMERRFASFDDYLATIVMADPARAARLPGVRDAMARIFDDRAERDGDAFVFTQPCVAWHFERR